VAYPLQYADLATTKQAMAGLWGMWGMVLSIPFVVTAKIISQHVEHLHLMTELLGD